jgi:hypothetical protein
MKLILPTAPGRWWPLVDMEPPIIVWRQCGFSTKWEAFGRWDECWMVPVYCISPEKVDMKKTVNARVLRQLRKWIFLLRTFLTRRQKIDNRQHHGYLIGFLLSPHAGRGAMFGSLDTGLEWRCWTFDAIWLLWNEWWSGSYWMISLK